VQAFLAINKKSSGTADPRLGAPIRLAWPCK
jgi:hypothetical protein